MTRSRDRRSGDERRRRRRSSDSSSDSTTTTQTPLSEPLRVKFKAPLPKEKRPAPFEYLVQLGLCYHTTPDITEQIYTQWMRDGLGVDETTATDAWRVFLQVRCALNPETMPRAERWREIHELAEQYIQYMPPAGMDIASHMLRTHAAPSRFCESLTHRLSFS